MSISNIDSTLIGDVVKEKQLGIEYCSPKNWISIKQGVSTQVEKKIKYGSTAFSPVNLFFNDNNKAVLTVGRIFAGSEDVKIDIDSYIQKLTKKFDPENIEKNNFVKNGIEFIELKINYGSWFTYRILFYNKAGDIVQFDYSLQKKFKQFELPAILSSIGSVKVM